MPRLKSRNNMPPISFRFLQPETGWDSTKVLPGTPSLRVVATALIDHRRGNKFYADKNGWSMDYETVVNEVDSYTALLNEKAGYFEFVEGADPPKTMPLPAGVFRTVAAGAKQVVGGVKAWLEMFGPTGHPVAHELAEERALVCINCPKHDADLGWIGKFEVEAAKVIRTQLGIKHDMKLATTQDAKLGLCTACLCPMVIKVHAPLDFALERMDDETKAKLHPECWMMVESKS